MFRKFVAIALLSISFLYSQPAVYVLCEGNFNTPNASLWAINSDHSAITGPIHWDPAVNPLGDVGQSLLIYQDKLYLVMNNSNTLEIADIADGFRYEKTIPLPNAGPRDIEIVNNIAYLSCWYLGGIIRIDLDSGAFLDTLFTDGLPEDLLYYQDKLYASITMNPDWSDADRVIEIEINDSLTIARTFQVIPGPGRMLTHDNCLYVASTYYDADWNTYAGNSKIDLPTGTVIQKNFGITFSFGADLVVFNDRVCRVYNGGICALTDSLTMDTTSQIGNYPNVYSAATYDNLIYFGLSDYTAPDNVAIMDSSGTELANFQVGALPGSFAFYNNISGNIANQNKEILQNFSLEQNYPNPFNNTTIISYTITKAGKYRLAIYNLAGQHIADLADGYHSAGTTTIQWNGTDKNGKPVASGSYLYQLCSEKQVITKRMIYLK